MTRYSVRRLSPFAGTLQVIEVKDARAFSANGLTWKLELQSDGPVPGAPWGEVGTTRPSRRYFTYGYWSAAEGLVRVPVNALLGDQSGHPAIPLLSNALAEHPALPFPAGDLTELWLLDAEDRLPLALLRSVQGKVLPPISSSEIAWRAAGSNPRIPGSAKTTTAERCDCACRQGLERMVARRAGAPKPVAQWFTRDSRGFGQGRDVLGGSEDLEGRRLPAGRFPELLLREDWPDGEARTLLGNYLHWQAPLLLTLGGLSQSVRAGLEHAAVQRAELLYGYRRVLPEIVQREVIDPAFVSAVLRNSAS